MMLNVDFPRRKLFLIYNELPSDVRCRLINLTLFRVFQMNVEALSWNRLSGLSVLANVIGILSRAEAYAGQCREGKNDFAHLKNSIISFRLRPHSSC